MFAQILQSRPIPGRTYMALAIIAIVLCLAQPAVAGDCYTAGRYIQNTCVDFLADLKQRFNEINNADCGALTANVDHGQYGRPGPQCCRNCTTYFGQDCYYTSNFFKFHAAMAGWNESTLKAGKRLANIMCMNRTCDSS